MLTMLPAHPVTRFAPSPTGLLHLGNARTALFNALAARSRGGRLILRIEDTDAERNDAGALAGLLDDLGWLGLAWDEGPDVGGPRGPYRQSERADLHAQAVASLTGADLVYPCFCTPEELQSERRAQLAAHRPPRYSGKCGRLSSDEVARRIAAGLAPALRFRVPPGTIVEFDDVIHGQQRFATDDIGDFVIRRADGGVAFFLGNAVDDADMGVTLVLRGDDHLANTPRQLLLLRALHRAEPVYGHLPLVLAPAGKPLSKREGAASLRDLRARGYLPAALRNYLVRLGHACSSDGWLDEAALTATFDISRVSRAAPHFDAVQLDHWQRQAVEHASGEELEAWLGERLDAVPFARRAAFVKAVRGNLTFPVDVDALIAIVVATELECDPDARAAIAAAGRDFFRAALAAWSSAGPDFASWTRAVRVATQTSGAALYKPLRAALTGATHGPELALLVGLMDSELVARRLGVAANA
jgi:glutamyl-tRNA synthetase